MTYKSPSLADLVLATLLSGRSTRIFKEILRERSLKRYKKESIRVELSRLGAKGYVQVSKTGWDITKQGEARVKNIVLLDYFLSPFSKNAKRNLIISFDIPEKKRVLRNWLRNQIKIFGFEMLQQSLWIGPGPMPDEFIRRLGLLGIRKNIKTFKVNIK